MRQVVGRARDRRGDAPLILYFVYRGAGFARGAFPLEGSYDSIGWPELLAPDGRLYTRVFEPYPHIRRYRIDLAGVAAVR